jgi:hypothetical protein
MAAFYNFVNPDKDTTPVPELDISNLPSAKPITSRLSDIATTITDTIDETTSGTIYKKDYSDLPSGMKFSEIIDDVIQSYDDTDLLSKDKINTSASANGKSLYYDDIASTLDSTALGPKDYYNKNLTGRSTDIIKPTVSSTNSDALQQGTWFRSERETSPYANSQCPETTSACTNQPPSTCTNQPSSTSLIDNNDYIRKDSIPCWGCKLK